MTGLPIVTGALGIVAKGLRRWLEEFDISGRIDTILATPQLV